MGRRVFLGGVQVEGDLAAELHTPLPFGMTLREAVIALGGSPGPATPGTPLIAIGGSPRARSDAFQIRAVFGGWRGGIVPAHADGIEPSPSGVMALAPMLAAALAVNEAFLNVSGDFRSAGRRLVGLDLWTLAPGSAWVFADPGEPAASYLPSRLWLIGLGHLGQAFLWALGLLPYADPGDVRLVLQDDDVITPSTESVQKIVDGQALIQMSRFVQGIIQHITVRAESLEIEVNVQELCTLLSQATETKISSSKEAAIIVGAYNTRRAKKGALVIEPEKPDRDIFDLPPDQLKKLVQGFIWRDEHFQGLTIRQIAEREGLSDSYVGKQIFATFELGQIAA